LQRFRLRAQGSHSRAAPEQLVDLPHERAGARQVGEGEVDVSQLDPGPKRGPPRRMASYQVMWS